MNVLISRYLAVKSDAAKLFWICAIAHLILWTLIPTLTNPNALTDVIEGFAWGHEWPLGTHKHPPLAAWILEAFAVITGRASWAPFLASQIAVLTAFWAVWQTGRRIAGEFGGLIGALLLVGIAYYNVITPEFNPNVLQLPLWALMGFSFYRAVKDDRIADWLLLGLWGALGLYAKYSSILMMTSLAICMFAHPESRKRLKRPGPWIAKLTTIVLFLPHIIWLSTHHFMPFTYTESRLETIPDGFVMAPVLLTVWQIAACVPAIVIFAVAFGRGKWMARREPVSFDGMFLLFAAFGSFVLALIFAVSKGIVIRNMWGTPFWNFLGLWAVFTFRPDFSSAALKRFTYIWGAVFIVGLIGIGGKNLAEPYITHKAGRIYFPGRALAQQIDDEWQDRYHTPLRYVIGDIWAAGNIGYYAPERPHVLINGDYAISPWVSPEDIAKYGGVIVWCRGDCTHQDIEDVPPWFWSEFSSKAEKQPVLTLPQQTGADVPPAKIGWAILPPQNADKP